MKFSGSAERGAAKRTKYFHSFSMILLDKIGYFSFSCIDSRFFFFREDRARSINIDRMQKTSTDCSQTFAEVPLDASLDELECFDIQHADHDRLFSFLFASKSLVLLVETQLTPIRYCEWACWKQQPVRRADDQTETFRIYWGKKQWCPFTHRKHRINLILR